MKDLNFSVANLYSNLDTSLYAIKFIGVSNHNRVQVTVIYSSLGLTKAKYGVSGLYMMENENEILRINITFIACDVRHYT